LQSSFAAAVGEGKRDESRDCGDTSIDRPLSLTCHKTAGQKIDSLEKPDHAKEEKKGPEDVQKNPHA